MAEAEHKLPTIPFALDGRLCRFLRSPRLWCDLFSSLSRDKQRRLLEFLWHTRIESCNAADFGRRIVAELDSSAGRGRLGSCLQSLPKLLIGYVETSEGTKQPVSHHFSKLIVVSPATMAGFTKGLRHQYELRTPPNAKRQLSPAGLTAERVQRIVSDPSVHPELLTAYVLGFALAQPSSARQICEPFMNASAEFREALCGGWDDDSFAAEFATLSGETLTVRSRPSQPGVESAQSPADTAESEMGSSEPAASAASPSVAAPVPPAVEASPRPAGADAEPLPSAIEQHLAVLVEVEQGLDVENAQRRYDRLPVWLEKRQRALDELRSALPPYYEQARQLGLAWAELPKNPINAEWLRGELRRLLRELASERQLSFERERRSLHDRLQSVGLLHRWPEPAPPDAAALQALESECAAELSIHEFASSLLSGRPTPLLDSARRSQALSVAEVAMQQLLGGRRRDELREGRLDVSALVRFLIQADIARERPGDVKALLRALADGPTASTLTSSLIKLAFALAQADPSNSPWSLLFTECRLAAALAKSNSAAFEELLAHLPRPQQAEVLRAWAALSSPECDLAPLVLALAAQLRATDRRSQAIAMLGTWLRSDVRTSEDGRAALLRSLRDALREDGRIAEALLLVSRACRAGHTGVLAGFEAPLAEYILDIAQRRNAGMQQIVSTTLADPAWLLRESYGPAIFLYICHLANLEEAVIIARYQYAEIFEKMRRFHPTLIDDYFLSTRFPVGGEVDGGQSSYASQVLHALNEFRRGLQKRACYKDWPPAEDYQRWFNERLKVLFAQTEPGAEPEPLARALDDIEPDEWILEADRALHFYAEHPARGLMADYLAQQILCLRMLAEARQRFGRHGELADLLKAKSTGLRQRLLHEKSQQQGLHPLTALVYDRVAEACP